ncbi:carboxylesterase [Loktanella sp. 3ANDIMAR09]|uniref:holin family protein n=1 Tax=Loktanella sp. 3ANDIMAR09 TaxID=1225657 RepID=UPI0006F259E1|nr:holin family protein [Loktanella sp. 3ANDIMAR09]KQI68605.1 carboxylesterase [Loktanella sp. 3ANDIMAR09]
MGLIDRVMGWVFGEGRNVVAETVEVFRENSEGRAQRMTDEKAAALAQFAAEFAQPRKGLFDRMIDGLNRLPRPLLALGTIGLFVAAMTSPAWFASRMAGVALIPEPLWWLMGAIVSFYFGARYQVKGQEFQRSVAESVIRGEAVIKDAVAPPPDTIALPEGYADNAALADWWRSRNAI